MTEYRFDIPTVSEANRAGHEHWRVRQKRAKAQRQAFSILWRALRLRFTPPGTVTFTRYSRGSLDSDNLPVAFKHVRDQLAAEIGIDDRDPRVTWCYAQKRVGKGNWFTVQLEEPGKGEENKNDRHEKE